MASIGGWWVSNHDAAPEERVRASFYANRLRESKRPHGGKLYVTNQRVVFCPHLVDAVLGGQSVAYDLATIEVAETVAPPSGDRDPYGGGRSERLQIELGDGRTAYFILDDLETAVAAILEAIADHTARA